MKEFLEFAGTLLYILFSILLFPLMVFTQCLLESWAAGVYVKTHYKPWMRNIRKKQKAFNPVPNYISLAVSRIKSLHW